MEVAQESGDGFQDQFEGSFVHLSDLLELTTLTAEPWLQIEAAAVQCLFPFLTISRGLRFEPPPP